MLEFNYFRQRKGIEYASMHDTEYNSRPAPDLQPVFTCFYRFQTPNFVNFLDKTAELARFAPEIIRAIEDDLDAHAREKKKLRLENRKFFASQTEDLPELDIEDGDLLSAENTEAPT